jgi:hypothetical protein
MQYELAISVHDLKVILIRLIDSHNEVFIKLRDKDEFSEPFWISHYDDVENIVTTFKNGNEDLSTQFSLLDIEYIEFDFLYQYREESAKILRVN